MEQTNVHEYLKSHRDKEAALRLLLLVYFSTYSICPLRCSAVQSARPVTTVESALSRKWLGDLAVRAVSGTSQLVVFVLKPPVVCEYELYWLLLCLLLTFMWQTQD